MKIAHICPFSSGSCGVWFRAKQEAIEFHKKGHKVEIFSTNIEKGTEKSLPLEDKVEDIKIHRFPAKKLGGESFMKWSFEKELRAFAPEIIIAHNYRHIHTLKCLKVRDKLKAQGKKCRVFLVTHAPFVEGNITRTFIQTAIVKIYDKTIGPLTLNRFDGILPISRWEIVHLEKMGAKKEKIFYIPNGIPEELFCKNSATKQKNKILFLGRVSPKKKIETIISAIPYIEDKSA
ncbi:glycosyltransferase family 4 protein, partial [Candidatus Pacearchaeota archaeon]|nr:glycosyltransferase family 4 protein [Candidatus Pacearchaeota archaeon]